MKKWTFNALAAVSLFFGAVVIPALWARSYLTNETVGWHVDHWQGLKLHTHTYGVSSNSGGILIFALHRDARFAAGDPAGESYKMANPEISGFKFLQEEPNGYPSMDSWYKGWEVFGLGFYGGARTPPMTPLTHRDSFVVVPCWLLFLVSGVMPTIVAVRWMREQFRLSSGRCRRCGYDLSATPTRCPECATIPPAQKL